MQAAGERKPQGPSGGRLVGFKQPFEVCLFVFVFFGYFLFVVYITDVLLYFKEPSEGRPSTPSVAETGGRAPKRERGCVEMRTKTMLSATCSKKDGENDVGRVLLLSRRPAGALHPVAAVHVHLVGRGGCTPLRPGTGKPQE